MMNIILVDDNSSDFFPFTLTRPIAKLRIGILTLDEKWQQRIKCNVSYVTQDYLSSKFPENKEEDNVFVNARLLPNHMIVKAIEALSFGQVLYSKEGWLAKRGKELKDNYDEISYDNEVSMLTSITDIFNWNGNQIVEDFKWITKNKTSNSLGAFCQVFGDYPVFIEEGAEVNAVTINTKNGPVYIGKDVEIMEGATIRGPFAACEGAVVKMNAKIYGDTTIGPFSKIGGEVSNSVILGYSNKGHDGFLGNSVIGEWCNLGADTNNSNLKNNYSNVKVWNYTSESFEDTGLQFCGLLMGDHSKTGINTMLNTGTVVGVCANIFGGGFPEKHIPSFSWGGSEKMVEFRLEKSFEVAEKMMERRKVEFGKEDKAIFTHLFEYTAKYRMSF